MIKTRQFYDTCSLLLRAGNLFDEPEDFIISSITLQELENIKTSTNKDDNIKFSARQLLHDLDEHFGQYLIINYQNTYAQNITQRDFELTNDTKILSCYLECVRLFPEEKIIFITNDLALKSIARVFTSNVQSLEEDKPDDYTGYKEITMSDDYMSDFYTNPCENKCNLQIGEYILVKNVEGELVDRLCWNGEYYRHLDYKSFNSRWFGEVKPIKGDPYQQLACDSLVNNKITMLKGPAGTGKTYLALGFLLHMLDRGQIDKVIIFCNTVATKNSAKLGFYPGSRDEKLLDSQIGNLLISKLGDRIAVEELMDREKLILLPMSDIRGYDTTGMNAGIYISEAQNLDITLMKLALQRIGEDSICIIDGDAQTQVDDVHFAGANNGMRRASKIFRGSDVYGEVELKTIHRSKIAEIAQKM